MSGSSTSNCSSINPTTTFDLCISSRVIELGNDVLRQGRLRNSHCPKYLFTRGPAQKASQRSSSRYETGIYRIRLKTNWSHLLIRAINEMSRTWVKKTRRVTKQAMMSCRSTCFRREDYVPTSQSYRKNTATAGKPLPLGTPPLPPLVEPTTPLL